MFDANFIDAQHQAELHLRREHPSKTAASRFRHAPAETHKTRAMMAASESPTQQTATNSEHPPDTSCYRLAAFEQPSLTSANFGGPASGSMPRSIFAIRSWCFRTIAMTAITPPTMMATIGTSNPPRPTIESTKSFQRLRKPTTIGQRLSANDRFSGGADRDRTGGLLVANQALSQLSYSPNCSVSAVARSQSLNGNRSETMKT